MRRMIVLPSARFCDSKRLTTGGYDYGAGGVCLQQPQLINSNIKNNITTGQYAYGAGVIPKVVLSLIARFWTMLPLIVAAAAVYVEKRYIDKSDKFHFRK
jgi:hypothetical protein